MNVYRVTDLDAGSQDWFVVKDKHELYGLLEKKYGQDPIQLHIQLITNNVSDFLENEKRYRKVWEVAA